jgi:hypothetical protein
MALGSVSGEKAGESTNVVTPRWVAPALFALWGAAAVALMLTGRVVFGAVIAAAIVAGLASAMIFRTQLRAFSSRAARASTATYGSLVLVGMGWIVLGMWRLTTPGSDLILGVVCVVFGLLMVLAYAPNYLKLQAIARNR